LLANYAIYSTALDITDAANQLAAESTRSTHGCFKIDLRCTRSGRSVVRDGTAKLL
jgi:hypothetical protein